VSPTEPVYEGSQPWASFGTPSLHVVKYGGEYVLWSGGTDGEFLSIGRATSMNGIQWTPDPDNPLVSGEDGSWDAVDVTEPGAIYAASGLTLFHAGSDTTWVGRIGCKVDPSQEVEGDLPPTSGVPSARLLAPSPNPFNPWTLLAFELDEPGFARLAIFDSMGRRIRVLSDGFHFRGRTQVAWDGRNGAGRPVVTGVYSAVLTTEKGEARSRLVLLR